MVLERLIHWKKRLRGVGEDDDGGNLKVQNLPSTGGAAGLGGLEADWAASNWAVDSRFKERFPALGRVKARLFVSAFRTRALVLFVIVSSTLA